ncbi:hypothetical protein ACHQM5_027086 [Ranunculus cassubicifolius]
MDSSILEDVGTIGFEEGKVWLPTHVLDEAFDPKNQHYFNKPHADKLHPRPRFHTSRASGGPGMQAIFLDSNQKSSGTGVFLPRGIGRDVQTSKKPACSPVLLPARVIQALNLNVHALGTQISPREAHKNSPRNEIKDLDNRKYESHDLEATVTTKGCVANSRSSPEIFLPKEWSY